MSLFVSSFCSFNKEGVFGGPVQVVWGESSMIEAERLLLATALEDPANQRFALISDRYFCVHHSLAC